MQDHGQPSNSNNALSLAEKMKEQMEEQVQSSKQIIQEGLQSLRKAFLKSAKHELSTIETAIKTETAELSKIQQSLIRDMHRSLKIPVAVSLAVTFVCCLVLVGGTLFWIDLQGSTLAELSEKIEHQRTIEKKLVSWGVTPLLDNNRRFIVLPAGTSLKQNWQSGNRPAILLKD